MFKWLSARVAKAMLSQVDSGQNMLMPMLRKNPPKLGTRGLEQMYNQSPWLRAVTAKIAGSISRTEWQLFVMRASPEGRAIKTGAAQVKNWRARQKLLNVPEAQQIEQHPFLDLFGFGNEYMDGATLIKLIQIHLETVGETFIVKERAKNGQLTGLWPVPPHWINDTPKPNKPSFEILTPDGRPYEIPMTEVVWISEPDPSNPFGRGAGRGRALADELETDEYASQHTKSWFYNRAVPELIISAAGLRKEDTARMEERWMESVRGFLKAYKPHFLNREIKVTQLSTSFNDMQLVELRRFERDTIMQVYGVPPEILGVLENSNRATIEAAEFFYAKHTLVPRIEILREAFQNHIIPEYDDRIVLHYDSPVEEDREFQLEVAKAAPWARTTNEWRTLSGLEPIDDEQADVLPPRGPDSVTIPLNTDRSMPSSKNVIPFHRKAVLPQPDALLQLLDDVKVQETLWAPVVAALNELILAWGPEQLLMGGLDFAMRESAVIRDYVSAFSGTKIPDMNQRTRSLLASEINAAIAAGESLAELEARITGTFSMMRESRASTIARTETMMATNFSAHEAMSQAGIGKKEWLATRDNAVRDEHLALDGTVIGINDEFEIDGLRAPYPGAFGDPAIDINCRCAVVAVFDGEGRASSPGETKDEDERAESFRSIEKRREPHVRRMAQAIASVFDEQEKILVSALQSIAA